MTSVKFTTTNIIITSNKKSQDGWITNSISAVPSPSPITPNQIFSVVGGQRARGTCTPEINSKATRKKFLDVNITLYPNWRVGRVWGCICRYHHENRLHFLTFFYCFRGVMISLLYLYTLCNLITNWGLGMLPFRFAELISPGPAVSARKRGKDIVNSEISRTSYNAWYLLTSDGLKKYCPGTILSNPS